MAGLIREGTTFVVVHVEVDDRSPARYGDMSVIDTIVSDLNAASVTFAHVVKEKSSGRVVVEGSARLVATDGHGRIKRLDKTTLAALKHQAEG